MIAKTFADRLLCCFFVSLLLAAACGALTLDQPTGDDEIPYTPADGATLTVTPPSFVWRPVAGASRYILQYGRDAQFIEGATSTIEDHAWSVYTPHETLAPGEWHWRYGVETDAGERMFSRPRRFTIADEAHSFPRPEIATALERIPDTRPRVHFTPETVAMLRANPPESHRAIMEPVIRNAEQRLGEDLYEEPPFLPRESQARTTMAVQIFRTMRPFTAGMETCAMAYLYTGDTRFAEEAKRRLLHFAAWELEGSSNVFHNTEPAMDIAMRGPRTYDWIYDVLTEEERALCETVLTSRLADMHRLHRMRPFESKPYASHPGRMIGFVVEGGIVFAHEAEAARDWLDYTLQLLWSVYPAWGGEDGSWHEGLSYWSAYVGWAALMTVELERLGIPWKNKPFMENTGWFGLYCGYPNRRTRAFGDGYEHPVGGGHANLMYTLASLYDNPYFRWYADQITTTPSGPTAFAVLRPELEGKPPHDLPQARMFPSSGWVAMHSDMAAPDDNIMLLFKSNPRGAISHDHANQNAFVIEAFGEALAISSGYYQRYGSPHHAEWVWQTRAHNAVLINGEGQVTRSAASHGQITAFSDSADFCFTTGDATPAYGGRATRALRHILFCRPDYFVVFDDIETAEPATCQWLLHTLEEMRLDEAAQQVNVCRGDARLRVDMLLPKQLAFTQTTGFEQPLDSEMPDQFHFTASTLEPATATRFAAVLHPYRDDTAALPSCEADETEQGIVLRVGNDLILWKYDGAETLTADGIKTRSAFTAIRRDASGNTLHRFER